MQMFSDKGTVDDLGIGTIRDAINNRLFPGTSIVQTRARYYLFIPWIYLNAEQRYPNRIGAKAQDMERSLIAALLNSGWLRRSGAVGAVTMGWCCGISRR